MHDARFVSRLNGCRDLAYDVGRFIRTERRRAARVSVQDLSRCPLDGHEMLARRRLADLYGAYHVGVLDAGSVLGFPEKPRDGRLVLPQLLPEDLECDVTVLGVVGPVDGGRSTFPNFLLEAVTG